MRRCGLLLLSLPVLVGVVFVATRPAPRPVDELLAAFPELHEVATDEGGWLRTGSLALADARARMDGFVRTHPFWRKESMPGQYNYAPPAPWYARVPRLDRFDRRKTVHVELDDGVPINMDRPLVRPVPPKGPYATLNVHAWRLNGFMGFFNPFAVGRWTVVSPSRWPLR